jgi:hypothetical protein
MKRFIIKNQVEGGYYRRHIPDFEWWGKRNGRIPAKVMPILALPVAREYAWEFRDEITAATVACLLGPDWGVEQCD